MDIKQLFLNRLSLNAVNSVASSFTNDTKTENKNTFDNLLNNKVENNKKNNGYSNTTKDSQAKSQPNQKVSKTNTNNQSVNTKQNENIQPTAVKETSKENANVSQETATDSKDLLKEVEDANSKIIKKLSEQMGISEEEIAQILLTLNMQPLELSDKGNLNTFLQAVFEVESPVELLNVPDIAQTIQSVDNMLVEFEEVAKIFNEQEFQTEASQPVLISAQNSEAKIDNEPVLLSSDSKVQQQQVSVTNEEPVILEHTEVVEDNVQPVEAQTQQNSTPKEMFNQQSGNENKQDTAATVQNTDFINVASDKATVQNTQFTQTVAKAQATSNINTQDVVNQLVDRMKVDVRGNLSEVRITLRPEHLGDVSLKITTENGIITAQFVAENERVKQIIESNFNQLKSTLEEQGIQVSQLSVSVGQDQQDERMKQFLAEQQKSASRISRIIKNETTAEDLQEIQEPINTTEILNNSVDYTA